MGCAAVPPTPCVESQPHAGLTTHHEIEAHTNRALIDRSRLVVVVADSSKIGRVGFARICELSRIDEIITDTAAEAPSCSAQWRRPAFE